MATATQWWHRREEQVVCTLCPRECALREGQRGFCFVRQNIADELVLTTYGRSSGFCIDPIEKKPLNHFLPGTPVLSFGTAGCNLGCKFCQNWSISKAKEFDDRTDFASPEAIAQAALQHGCRSVAFTYNDPVVWAEYAIDTARACHDRGIKTVAVTAGYISAEARGPFYEVMDAANVDLKGFTSEFYQHVTLAKLEPVLETLKWLKHETDVWFEITNLMIPGENDSADETSKMCDWIVENLGPDVPVHFTAFHPDFRMLDRPRTPPETLLRARQQALAAGIRYPYVGNIHDVLGQSTYCHNCQAMLIQRDWYVLGKYALRDNCCAQCGTEIPGVFDKQPGKWGAQRKPIRISPPQSNQQITIQTTPLNLTSVSPSLPTVTLPVSSPLNPLVLNATMSQPTPRPSSSQGQASATTVSTTESKTATAQAQRTAAPPTVNSVAAAANAVVPVAISPPVKKAAPLVAIGSSGSPSNQNTSTLPSTAIPATRIDFSNAEATLIANHARAVAEATFSGSPAPQLSSPLAQTPAYGMFVSFKQGETLRACKGQFGQIAQLGTLLNTVTRDSATNDPRFAPLKAEELARSLIEVSLMYNPQMITAQGEARVGALQIGQHGLVIAHPKGRGLLLPQVATERSWDAPTFLQAVCRKAGLPSDTWKLPEAQLMTFEARLFHSPGPGQPQKLVRPAARAGQFYPANPQEMRTSIQQFLGQPENAGAQESPVRAVMLPHAGWLYCGNVMGRTLARTKVPRTVIIIGPKHTGNGATWSVSNADTWQIPGAEVPVATELRSRLLEMVPTLTSESAAHSQEHAIEVIVPFLLEKNPELRILPIVMGPTAYNQTERLARAVAILCQDSAEPILLVISSDMNHFAAEAENRRLDAMALNALGTGDASKLFDTVRNNNISMCGVIPAVTILRALQALGSPAKPQLVHYDTSSTASGKVDRVVGYAGALIP
jgi:pyruvate formate lyase activating enzyme